MFGLLTGSHVEGPLHLQSISMGQRGWGRQSRQTEQALQPSEQPQQQEQAGPSRRAQPVADVGSGFHPDDIKARLSGIRVYVMTDDQDKIVFCKLHGTVRPPCFLLPCPLISRTFGSGVLPGA